MRKGHKTKWDWAAARREFLLSDYAEVKLFFTEKYHCYNAQVVAKTKGWSEEKKKRDMETTNRILDAMQNAEVKEKSETLKEILKQMSVMVSTGKLSPQTLKEFWYVFRTENNLPSSISKQSNLNIEPKKDAVLDEKTKEIFEQFGI